MQIQKLELKNYRNYEAQTIATPPGIHVLLGQNAQGKTNVLEAIWYGALGRSHRAKHDRELLRFTASEGRVVLTIARVGVSHTIEFRFSRGARRQIFLNGAPIGTRALIGLLNVVLFSPEDLFLVKGAPEGRRRFLNMELSQADGAYFHALSLYTRLLQQRNALLKQLRERRGDPAELVPWDVQLSMMGARVTARRLLAVRTLGDFAREVHAHLTDGAEMLTLSYEHHGGTDGAFPLPFPCDAEFDASAEGAGATRAGNGSSFRDRDAVENTLRLWYNERMEAARQDDIRRGSTSVGPHLDDLRLTVNGSDLRIYGSQGQQRTGALSLKLAELSFLRAETGEYPVLLLDDVMSELDGARRAELLDFLVRAEIQTFITATDAAYFPSEIPGFVYRVFRGKVYKAGEQTETPAT